MAKFPVDAPKSKVIKVLEGFGFVIVREKEHISMVRQNADGTSTPLTMPNHKLIWRSLDKVNFRFWEGHVFGLINT
ncbi:MAG: hypothetical protein ACKPCM_12830 [Pseudanabaena sp.]